jgi:SNF2 family DNA or RNA helicase
VDACPGRLYGRPGVLSKEDRMIRAGRIWLRIPFEQKEKCKMIAGYRFDFKGSKMWNWPMSAKVRIYQIFPEHKEQIEKEIAQYKKACKRVSEVNKMNLDNIVIDTAVFKRPPMKHQVLMIRNMVARKLFGLFCEMGTGKTQAVINAFQVLFEDKLVKKCLIICPKTVMDNWSDEIQINSDYKSILLNGSKAERLKKLKQDAQFYIINFDGLLVLKDYDHWDEFDVVALDESSRIKNPKAKRTLFILDKFRFTKYKYILSGTPITQSPIDIFTQFNFLDPCIFSHKSYYDFRDDDCILQEIPLNKKAPDGTEIRNPKQITGYKNLDNLQLLIKGHSIQLRKEQCADLPERIYTKRSIDLPKILHDQCEDIMAGMKVDLIAEGDHFASDNILTQFLRVHQILSGAYLEKHIQNKKLIELADIIQENLYNGNQIIIWANYRKSIELIEKMIQSSKKSIPYSILHGDIQNRKEQIDLFQKGLNKVFIGQVSTGGLGINLTAGNIVVYYENNFSLEDRLQSEARAHRIGQHKPVTYIDLLYKGSLDEKIFEAIRNKSDVAEYLVKSFRGGEYK